MTAAVAPARCEGEARLKDLCERYLEAQLRGDRRAALSLVLSEGLERGVSVWELREQVIGAAQRRIGELWQRNAIGIAEEHMATAVSNLVLAQLYERSEPTPRNQKTVMVACVEGELHELPARLVADALDGGGFDVRFLGASVPVSHLLTMIEAAPTLDLLALSATMSFTPRASGRPCSACARRAPRSPSPSGVPSAGGRRGWWRSSRSR